MESDNFPKVLEKEKVIKKNQKLLTTIIIIVLLSSVAYAILTPSAHAAEITTQQKGLTICADVLGINMTNCNITTKDYPPTSQSVFLGVIPQETIIYDLTNGKNNLSLLDTFANGNLQMLQVIDDSIKTSTKQTPLPNAAQQNVLGAQIFLTNYQRYAGDSLYSSLKSTLNNISTKTNQTITSGNLQLEVTSCADGSTNFKWYYTANGATAPYSKFISLGFNNGHLTAFVNNWQFYNIGSTNTNVSKEKAIAIALEAAKTYAYNMSLETSGFQAKNVNESNIKWSSLIFDNSLGVNNVRDDDQLALYPDWRIGVTLDKWYGEMYGLEIDIWADTGQIRSIQEAYSPMSPTENASLGNAKNQATVASDINPDMSMLISVSVISLAIVGTTIVWIVQKNRLHFAGLIRPFSRKSSVLLLCILLSLSVFFESFGTVGATTRGAAVWGSTSSGSYGYGLPQTNYTWRKSQDEIGAQNCTANYIAMQFAANGYTGNPNIDSIDHQGSASTQPQICSDVLNLQSYNDYIAVVDFDHGVGGYPGQGGLLAPTYEEHYMFEDDTGTVRGTEGSHYTDWSQGVYDMEIYPWVAPMKVTFAFINTCLSANLDQFGQGMLDPVGYPPCPARALGMPYAWTHRYVESPSTSGFTITQDISNDGYNNPDWASQVYIGFPYGSASLSQNLPITSGQPYYNWVASFFNYALDSDISVNQALNYASDLWYGCAFSSSQLQTGFTADWWNFGTQSGCTMAVYGNGNIHLKNFTPPADVASIHSINGPTSGMSGNSIGPFSAFATNPYANSIQYDFNWGDGSPDTYTGGYSDGQPATDIYHTWATGGLYSVSVRAKTANSDWSSWSNPITVNIDNQPLYWISVDAYSDQWYLPYYPNLWIDGSWVGWGSGIQITPGWHTISTDYYVNNYNDYYSTFVCFADSNGNYYYDNQASVYVYTDTSITAWYDP